MIEGNAERQQPAQLEGLRKRGYEVLYMTDPIDPFAVSSLNEFEGKPLLNAMTEDLKLEAEESTDAEHGGRGQAEKHRRQQRYGALVKRQLLLRVDGVCMVPAPLREEVVLPAGRLEGLDRLQPDDRGRKQPALLHLQA